MHIGTTSYIVPGDLVDNARHLAGRADHMQLVLFDVPGGPCNYPSPAEVKALRVIADATGLTYTVHLPLDLHLGPPDDRLGHLSLTRARAVINATRDLTPVAYIAHLDGRELLNGPWNARAHKDWCAQTIVAVEHVVEWIGDPALLAVENLQTYPLDIADPVLAQVPVSRCVDVGHLWLDGHDPLPVLAAALPRTSVIHLHGLNGRDHQSVAHMQPERLDPVIAALLDADFDGLLTLEVFEKDYETSLEAVHASVERRRASGVGPQSPSVEPDVHSTARRLTPDA